MSTFDDLVRQADRAAQALLGGELVTYTPSTVGSPVQVTGIFDEVYALAVGDAQAGVETLGPAIFFRLEDLPTDLEEDDPILTIRGVDYRVIEPKPDGLGGVRISLRKVT